jgi:hypothetical protein
MQVEVLTTLEAEGELAVLEQTDLTPHTEVQVSRFRE